MSSMVWVLKVDPETPSSHNTGILG